MCSLVCQSFLGVTSLDFISFTLNFIIIIIIIIIVVVTWPVSICVACQFIYTSYYFIILSFAFWVGCTKKKTEDLKCQTSLATPDVPTT